MIPDSAAAEAGTCHPPGDAVPIAAKRLFPHGRVAPRPEKQALMASGNMGPARLPRAGAPHYPRRNLAPSSGSPRRSQARCIRSADG